MVTMMETENPRKYSLLKNCIWSKLHNLFGFNRIGYFCSDTNSFYFLISFPISFLMIILMMKKINSVQFFVFFAWLIVKQENLYKCLQLEWFSALFVTNKKSESFPGVENRLPDVREIQKRTGDSLPLCIQGVTFELIFRMNDCNHCMTNFISDPMTNHMIDPLLGAWSPGLISDSPHDEPQGLTQWLALDIVMWHHWLILTHSHTR